MRVACRILAPRPGIEPVPPAVEAQSLNHWTTREVPVQWLFVCLFVYLWLCWVFVDVHGLSLVVASGDYSLLQCSGFTLRWLLLLRSTGSRRVGFSSCGMRVQ